MTYNEQQTRAIQRCSSPGKYRFSVEDYGDSRKAYVILDDRGTIIHRFYDRNDCLRILRQMNNLPPVKPTPPPPVQTEFLEGGAL